MTEERRCYNCAIDLICQECNEDDSNWQPIAQEKPIEKIQYTRQEWASIIDDLGWNPDVMEELKQKGYIRKTVVEEAEEYEKHFARIIDLGLSCTIKDLEYSMRIIERLKSEIERLKK
jgi:flagellar biosynthesis regulator FlaF